MYRDGDKKFSISGIRLDAASNFICLCPYAGLSDASRESMLDESRCAYEKQV